MQMYADVALLVGSGWRVSGLGGLGQRQQSLPETLVEAEG